LERWGPGLTAEQRARAQRNYASEVFRHSGERIEFQSEAGASVKYEPTQEDIDSRKVRLDLKAMAGGSGATLAFWIAILATSAAIGLLTPVDRRRGTVLARLVQRNIDRAFRPREDGTVIFRPFGSFGTGYAVSTTEDEETLRQWQRRSVLVSFWGWPFLLLVNLAPGLLLFAAMPTSVAVGLLSPVFLFVCCLCGVVLWQQSLRTVTKGLQTVPPRFATAPWLQPAAERMSRRAVAIHASGSVAVAAAALFCLVWEYRVLGTWQTLGLAAVVAAGLCYYLWCRLVMSTKSVKQ